MLQASRRDSISKSSVATGPRWAESAGLGRWWRIEDAAAFGKAGIRSLAAAHPHCGDFIARGLPLRSEELEAMYKAGAKRTKRTENNSAHTKLFAASSPAGRLLLYCTEV